METILSKIFVIRGKKVLIDRHLAELYAVSTCDLNRAVKRNIKRFPSDFMFQINKTAMDNLMFQFGTSRWGGVRKLPYVFTEQGIAMLSGILNSDRAILVNIQIMRVFTKLREMLSTHEELKKKFEEWEKKYDLRLNKIDGRVQTVLEAFEEIKKLLNPPSSHKKRIGFIRED